MPNVSNIPTPIPPEHVSRLKTLACLSEQSEVLALASSGNLAVGYRKMQADADAALLRLWSRYAPDEHE